MVSLLHHRRLSKMLNLKLGKKMTNNDIALGAFPPTGSFVALVGGSYNGHFAVVTSYTAASVRIRLQHDVAQPWARLTHNVKVVVRHGSIRIATPSEHSPVTSIRSPLPSITPSDCHQFSTLFIPTVSNAVEENKEPDIELLARLVALRIVEDPNPHIRSLFLSELDRALQD